MAPEPSPNMIEKALEWVVDVDVPALKASVEALRDKHPEDDEQALAQRIYAKATWKAAATGVATGLPANPWTAAPAAVTDVAITLRIQVLATAKTALVYDPDFFDDDHAQWELLVPVFGINAASQMARELGIRGGMGVTRVAIRKYLSKTTLKQFKKLMWKYFGLKVTQKGVVTKTLPIVGGIIGGTWNWVEVRALRARTISYFEGRALSA